MTFDLILKLLFGSIIALAVVPVSTNAVDKTVPRPVATYVDAIARYQLIVAAETTKVAPPGRSILLAHPGRTGRAIILIHGLTNTPRQFRDLGDILYACGANVYIPRLPKHGYRNLKVSALRSLSPQMLRAFADSAVDLTAALGDTVIVVGLSAGGTVAAWMAQYRHEVDRALIIAPAFAISRIPSFLRTPSVNLFSRLPNITIPQQADTARYVYRGVSTRGLAETLRFGKGVSREAEHYKAAAPYITLVMNDNDHTVAGSDIEHMAKRWREYGTTVTEFRFGKEFRLPHDVIDVLEPAGNTRLVYPVLLDLIDGIVPTLRDSTVSPAPRCGMGRDTVGVESGKARLAPAVGF